MEERVDHMLRARAAGRHRRPAGVHPAGLSPRQQPDAQAAGAERDRHAPGTPCHGSCSTTSRTSRRSGSRLAWKPLSRPLVRRRRPRRHGPEDTSTIWPIPHAEGMTTKAIRRLIRSAGRDPYERDTLYNVITGPDRDVEELSHGIASRG
jgi:hypothetical protein